MPLGHEVVTERAVVTVEGVYSCAAYTPHPFPGRFFVDKNFFYLKNLMGNRRRLAGNRRQFEGNRRRLVGNRRRLVGNRRRLEGNHLDLWVASD